MNVTNKPIHEIRLGRVRASIWENKTEKGVNYSVSVTRLFKASETDPWSSTDSFFRDDLPLVGKVTDMAHTWLFEKHGQEAKEV